MCRASVAELKTNKSDKKKSSSFEKIDAEVDPVRLTLNTLSSETGFGIIIKIQLSI